MAYHSGILAVCLLASLTMNVVAQDSGFRLETDVFEQGKDKPAAQTVTLFRGGIAFDFPRDAPTVTMVDPQGNRIVLFDSERKIQAVINLSELSKLITIAKSQAPELIANIITEAETVREEEKQTVVGGAVLKYTATHQSPPKPEYARDYAAFANALAQLNAGREPARLPYARLKLNDVLRKKSVMPKEVTRTISVGSKPVVTRSVVHATWSLGKEHDKRIASVGEMLTTYTVVPQRDFFAPRIARTK